MSNETKDETETTDLATREAGKWGLTKFLTPEETAMIAGDAGDPEAAARAIFERVLAAETPEEAFGDETTIGGGALIGQAVTIRGFTLNLSDFAESGPPVYAVLDVVTADGESVKVTSGSARVLAGLLRARQAKWLPLVCRFERADKPTKRGYYPMRLVLGERE